MVMGRESAISLFKIENIENIIKVVSSFKCIGSCFSEIGSAKNKQKRVGSSSKDLCSNEVNA